MSSSTKRLALVISALDVGGASRAMATLANAWAARGIEVTVIQLDWERPSFFQLHPNVRERHLDLITTSSTLSSAIRNNIRRVRVLRRELRRYGPDVVVSFLDRTNVLVLLAMALSRTPTIVSDRSAGDPTSRLVWRALRRLTYQRANAIVLQTAAMAREYPRELRRRVTVIPNPVPELEAPGDSPSVDGLIVAMGRLVPQKSFELLIDAFALLSPKRPEARLEIWGAGPEEARLRERIVRLGLAGRVSLPGQTARPADVLSSATVVALSSKVEGFPNVLLEAMALGRPVVALDCRYGPAEIIRDGVDGLLVTSGEPRALAGALLSLLEDPAKRQRMGARAREVRDRFSVELILAKWDALIAEFRPRKAP